MKNLMTFVTTALCVALLSSAALADWDPGDGHKMHFPQLPDPLGWDVAFNEPNVLADDWKCSETGTVDDIHFWFSSHQDLFDDPGQLVNVHASIHEDDRTGPFSKPGALLWERDFTSTEVVVRQYETGNQGWYDPVNGVMLPPPDHFVTWQANITGITDAFVQQVDTIYWLDLSVVTATPDVELGWKTSQDHFEDDAVWSVAGTGWNELFDPIIQPPRSLDLAFVITGSATPPVPEPAGLGLIGMALAALRRKRR